MSLSSLDIHEHDIQVRSQIPSIDQTQKRALISISNRKRLEPNRGFCRVRPEDEALSHASTPIIDAHHRTRDATFQNIHHVDEHLLVLALVLPRPNDLGKHSPEMVVDVILLLLLRCLSNQDALAYVQHHGKCHREAIIQKSYRCIHAKPEIALHSSTRLCSLSERSPAICNRPMSVTIPIHLPRDQSAYTSEENG